LDGSYLLEGKSMMRMGLTALVGGIVLFLWGAFAHVVLPIQDMAVKQLPNEQMLLDTLAANVHERSVYLFPGIDMRQPHTDAEIAAWENKGRNGPSGFLVYRPNGGELSMGGKLLKQFLTNLVAAIIVVLILRIVRFTGSYAACVSVITGVGILAWVSVSVPQWTWYEFTPLFLIGDLVDQLGWFVAGLAMAALYKPKRVS